jgi:hypothetical protein
MSEQSAKSLTFTSLESGIVPWTLLGFVLLSALVHAFGFYVFQTLYPPAAHVGPAPVQVGLLTPGTPEADAILRWIDSEDPALTTRPDKAVIQGLETVPYVPSYQIAHSRPGLVPTIQPPLPYPAGVSGLDLVELAAAKPAASATAPASVATVLNLSGGLKETVLEPLPSFDGLRAANPGPLEPARFLIGISPKGEAQYVFLQDSSGDKKLDETASRLLERVRFHAFASGTEWGFATFFWGSAAYGQAAPSPGGSP